MSDSLDLERTVRGQIAGFLFPTSFWICRQKGQTITCGVESYDRHIGLSKLTAPGLKGEPATMQYWNPLWSLSLEGKADVLAHFGKR